MNDTFNLLLNSITSTLLRISLLGQSGTLTRNLLFLQISCVFFFLYYLNTWLLKCDYQSSFCFRIWRSLRMKPSKYGHFSNQRIKITNLFFLFVFRFAKICTLYVSRSFHISLKLFNIIVHVLCLMLRLVVQTFNDCAFINFFFLSCQHKSCRCYLHL